MDIPMADAPAITMYPEAHDLAATHGAWFHPHTFAHMPLSIYTTRRISLRNNAKSLMDMPPEIFHMIIDLALGNDSKEQHHPDHQAVVIHTHPSHTDKLEYDRPTYHPGVFHKEMFRLNTFFHALCTAKFYNKVFYFSSLDALWAFHKHHPHIAHQIKNVDVTGHGYMTWAGMALLLRHHLETLTIRSIYVPCGGYQDDTTTPDTLILRDHINGVFASLPGQVILQWAPTLELAADGTFSHLLMPKDIYPVCAVDNFMVSDAIRFAFANDRSTSPLLPSPSGEAELDILPTLKTYLEESGDAVFADERKGWMTDVVTWAFTKDMDGAVFEIDEEDYGVAVEKMGVLKAVWRIEDVIGGRIWDRLTAVEVQYLISSWGIQDELVGA